MDYISSVPKELFYHIISFVWYDKNKLCFVSKLWYTYLRDINLYCEYNSVSFCESLDLLKKTYTVPTKRTVTKLKFTCFGENRLVQFFHDTYHEKLWQNITRPTLDQIIEYYRLVLRSKQIQYNIFFFGRCVCRFNYVYNLLLENKVKFKFDDDIFTDLCYWMGKKPKFICWLIKERPNNILITINGIENLVDNNFPSSIIRDFCMNYNQSYIYLTEDNFEEDLSSRTFIVTTNVKQLIIDKVFYRYVFKLIGHINGKSETEIATALQESKFFVRFASLDRLVEYILFWCHGRSDNERLIEQVIEANLDIHPYEHYYRHSYYITDKPYRVLD